MIHILSPEIANRIAAGEVVERPASIVRELIDNAVDAGATRIDVDIEQGGLKSIRITDNGCGMSQDDAAICLKRHATSKIHDVSDLDAIMTKGFRGEALAAISSVSRLDLKTRLADSEWGTQIISEGGVEKEPQNIGTGIGTSITISDLFYNTPARRKFLKKPATEMNHVLSAVTWNGLAHENIHFTFSHNGRRSVDLPSVSSRAERIQQLFNKKVLDEMIPVCLDNPIISLSGFISRPTLTRNGSQHIFFFVNNRFIKDRLLHRALMNGYRNLIHAGRYPVVFLYLEIDPSEIDVNVHPTKQEIKFSREDAIFSAVYGSIRQAWDVQAQVKSESGSPNNKEEDDPLKATEQLLKDMDKKAPVYAAPEPSSAEPQTIKETAAAPEPFKPSVIKQLNREADKPIESIPTAQDESIKTEPVEESADLKSVGVILSPPKVEQTTIIKTDSPEAVEPPAEDIKPAEKSPEGVTLGALRDLIEVDKKPDTLFDARSLEEAGELVVLGQLMNNFIMAEGKDGLFIIDQHAAHERLLFEKFYTQSKNAPLASQTLLFPITLDFAPDEVGLVEDITDLLKSLGFIIEPFGGSTFVVRSIPSSLSIEESEQFIKDFLGEVRHEGSADDYKDKALHTLACRAAVKFGDELSIQEMEGIIQGLQKIPRRNVCPHGRPALMFIAEKTLLRVFKRTGF